MDLPKRKNIRLNDYNYSSNGAYFITICTKNKENLLWKNVGANCVRPLGSFPYMYRARFLSVLDFLL